MAEDEHPGRSRPPTSSEAVRERDGQPLPAALPVLPLKDMVTYPDTLTPLAVGQERSMRLIDDVLSGERTLVMVASRDPELEEPGPDQLHDVGVAGVVARMLKIPDGTIRVLVQATERVRIGDYVAEQPYLVAADRAAARTWSSQSPELEALTRNVQRTFSEIIEQIPYLPEELQLAVTNVDDPSALAHLIAGALRIPTEEKQELLEEVDVGRRLRRLSEILARELEVIQLGSQIQSRGPVGDREGPARVLPARAAEGDPARARRGGRDPGRGQRAARADRGGGAARAGAQGGRPRARRGSSACRRPRPSTA